VAEHTCQASSVGIHATHGAEAKTAGNGTSLVDNWIICRRPSPSRTADRLFCFHHAGGSAVAFVNWSAELGNGVEVCAIQTPGRENLFAAPRHRSIQTLVRALLPQLSSWLDRPFAFFGHSLGALVAFATANILRDAGGPSPTHLFLSGCRPPHLPRAHPNLSEAPEEELIDALRELGSRTFPALENLELRNLLLPILRDDLRMAETCQSICSEPLLCPISVFGGADDGSADKSALQEWERYTLQDFNVQIFPGGHFFVEESQDAILGVIRRRLQRTKAPFASRTIEPCDGSESGC
jgi:medium-chain acyl-[acyl-carrier-protein] hydrolase